MAKGKKYNDDIMEKAFALLAINNNVQYVANELNLPHSTVRTWQIKFESENFAKNGKNLANLREKRKAEFINSAWDIIDKAKIILDRRLNRVIERENDIDSLIDEAYGLSREDISDTQRRELFKKLSAIKVEDIGKITIVLGTMYDKQALSNKDATQIIEGSIQIKKFEDF